MLEYVSDKQRNKNIVRNKMKCDALWTAEKWWVKWDFCPHRSPKPQYFEFYFVFFGCRDSRCLELRHSSTLLSVPKRPANLAKLLGLKEMSCGAWTATGCRWFWEALMTATFWNLVQTVFVALRQECCVLCSTSWKENLFVLAACGFYGLIYMGQGRKQA